MQGANPCPQLFEYQSLNDDMTDEQILKKAIEKAVENGYKINWFYKENKGRQLEVMIPGLIKNCMVYRLIFSHNFAKAFWKDDDMQVISFSSGLVEEDRKQSWQYHLQQMVLDKNPLKYLEKFL